MGNSIFKNFDSNLDSIAHIEIQTTFGKIKLYHLHGILIRALEACCKKIVDENGGSFRKLLSSDEFLKLHKKFYELVEIGYENRNSLKGLKDIETAEIDDYGMHEWAIHGMTIPQKHENKLAKLASMYDEEFRPAQIYGYAVLRMLDDGLTEASKQGTALNLLLILDDCAYVLCDALKADASDQINESIRFTATNLAHQHRTKRRQIAAKGGLARSERSNKSRQKALAKVKWEEWQAKPHLYRGKSEFARQMLNELNPSGTSETSIQSTKTIEDWCRDWEKALSAK